jgi:hypothetical protein
MHIPVYILAVNTQDELWAWAANYKVVHLNASQEVCTPDPHEIIMVPDVYKVLLVNLGLGVDMTKVKNNNAANDELLDPNRDRLKDRDLGVVYPRGAMLIGPGASGEAEFLHIAIEGKPGECTVSKPETFLAAITPLIKA